MSVSYKEIPPIHKGSRGAYRAINLNTAEEVGLIEGFAEDAWVAVTPAGDVVAGPLAGNVFPDREEAARALFRQRYCAGRES